MSRWLGAMLLAVFTALAASGPAATQADDLGALDRRFRALYGQGKYADAATIGERVLKITAQAYGPDDPATAAALNNLAVVYYSQGRYEEALKAYGRALAIREKAPGTEHADVASTLNNLAGVYYSQGRYEEALNAFGRALAINEKALGPEHPDVAATLNNLAVVYRDQGRHEEALKAFGRALAIREKALGPEHPDVAATLNNLASVYWNQGRYEEALKAFGRALAIREKALGPEHPDVAASLVGLANVYYSQGRYEEALKAYGRALAIREKALGPEHADVASTLNNLAVVYYSQGRHEEALKAYGRALAIYEKALGAEHPDVAQTLNNLAGVYYSQGRYEEAHKAFSRALAIREKALGPDHPRVASTLNNLAVLEIGRRNWAEAQHYWERATHILERRTSLGAPGLGQPLVGKGKDETARSSGYFQGLVKTAWRRGGQGGAESAGAMFVKAQWAAASEAAAALTQMAVRSAKGDPRLGALVRERQDLLAEWQKRDEARTAAASTQPEKRNKEVEAENVARISRIEARISELDAMLKDQFPDYAALASAAVVSMADVQAVLRDDEALLMVLDTDAGFKPMPEETFIWVITKTDARWVRSELGTEALRREVAALRCGLDRDRNWSWDAREGRWQAQSDECRVLAAEGLSDGAPLPFDLARADALYKSLFGEVEDLVVDKHLLIVPSGALNALPFQVLVTEHPAEALPLTEDGYAKAKWLGARNAMTVLPAVSSLKALRITAKPSHAAEAYIGFGNPLLTGPKDSDRSAWDHQHCRQSAPLKRVRVAQAGRAPEIAALLKGGLGNVEDLRRQNPLPETAEELCSVARDLGIADPDKVVNLGAKATEAHVKALSASGTLARARVVHFATHGFVAGETAMFAANHAEPALLLTPPKTASEEDDGLVTASEVAALKLDADWVILSACNTAAGDSVGGDALSGLARAFFYAGARALLVSHWYVNSKATAELITKSFDALKADPKIGRAEALRRAMAALVASGGRTAHPAAWAPFVVVGEGGVAR